MGGKPFESHTNHDGGQPHEGAPHRAPGPNPGRDRVLTPVSNQPLIARAAPGLRSAELALLTGVSVDYVVRLEQGRGPRPSTSVLAALARALRLDDVDRDLLFRFAGAAPPQSGRIAMVVRPSVLRLLDRMADLPALVLSAKADVLAWNSMAAAALDLLQVTGIERFAAQP
ncbi:helix-turn-helix domain-containing protein [Nocardia sp. NPDC050793]|uniref:helix-turn-helix domain-containing protein n=1 Tax=Nocardia sp. NPDC050793 TaxID=3155159 RepID=UPI0033C30FC7